MNIEKNLILIKNEDKTEEIINCSPITNGKRIITYKNNKTYTYSSYNIEWSRSCTEIGPQIAIVYEKRIPISGITKIIKFEELGYIRLIFKTGYHKLYHKSQLELQKNSLEDSNCIDYFSYLKELAGSIDFENDNDFISRQYQRMTAISPDSVLAKYLNHKTIKSTTHSSQIIFPFGFNISQKEATEKALNNQISVIKGPPGTGKTQTILNIIANAVMEEKTVVVVSNNNSATLNVFEKLRKYNIDFIASYLGNKKNRTEFFENQNGKYPDISTYKVDNEQFQKIKDDLADSQKLLEEKLEEKNKLALLNMEKANLITENGHFEKYNNEDKLELSKSLPRQSSNKIMSFLIEYNMLIEEYGYVKLLYKLKFLIMFSIWNFAFYDNSPESIQKYLNQLYYKLRLEELNEEIQSLENKLDRYDFDNEMKKYSKNSMTLLKHTLYKRYNKEINKRINTSILRNIPGEYNEANLSLVFSMGNGYKEVYKYYLMLQKGLSVNSNVFSLSMKELSLLYEYWCFIKINSLLKRKYQLVSSDLLKINKDGITVSLKKGVESSLTYCNPQTNEKFKVYYNSRRSSKTVSQKPDNILSIHKEGSVKSYEFIFDAKYKIGTSEEYIQSYGSAGPKEEDVNTMHRYRDAIIYAPMKKARSAIENLNNKDKLLERKNKIKNPSEAINNCIFGAFVLFPYDNEEEFKNHRFYKSIEEVNIGAIPFLPSTTKLMEDFLDEIIEESSYSSFERAIEPVGKDDYFKDEYFKQRTKIYDFV